jgi:hypothetical protein
MDHYGGKLAKLAPTVSPIGASLGRDCALDRVTEHKWFNIAAANGSSEAARLRTELAAEMTRDEIAQAQRLAREYLAAHRSIG